MEDEKERRMEERKEPRMVFETGPQIEKEQTMACKMAQCLDSLRVSPTS